MARDLVSNLGQSLGSKVPEKYPVNRVESLTRMGATISGNCRRSGTSGVGQALLAASSIGILRMSLATRS